MRLYRSGLKREKEKKRVREREREIHEGIEKRELEATCNRRSRQPDPAVREPEIEGKVSCNDFGCTRPNDDEPGLYNFYRSRMHEQGSTICPIALRYRIMKKKKASLFQIESIMFYDFIASRIWQKKNQNSFVHEYYYLYPRGEKIWLLLVHVFYFPWLYRELNRFL